MKEATLRAPFPWFGGKRRVAPIVWQAFGDVPNYVEPFAGSLAVLLGRPTLGRIETVNDLDCYLANFWRAVQLAPDDVAKHADWPVNEADLHARHKWLVAQKDFREKMRSEPEHFDAKIAGWWVWGICQWIGSGWCSPDWSRENLPQKLPLLGGTSVGKGVHSHAGGGARGIAVEQKRPTLGRGSRGVLVSASRPSLSAVRGVQLAEKMPKADRGTASRLQPSEWSQLPAIGGSRGASGAGVVASAVDRSHPGGVRAWMEQLAWRLRRVRVVCGDWKRVLGPSVTTHIGTTAVFLDPPYGGDAGRDPQLYASESLVVAGAVREWALENGSNRKMRIALCGLEGEHEMPESWKCVEWCAQGGYSRGKQAENRHRERIWLSPHCLPFEPLQGRLFA